MLIILSGEIGSGKTTRLRNWVENNKKFKGLLQLNVDGNRWLFDISTKQSRQLTTQNTGNIIEVGNYKFDKDVMKWGRDILDTLYNNNYPNVIADEYGKLEMNNLGLEPVFGSLIKKSIVSSMELIVVVRDYLVSQFIEKFYLTEKDFKYFSEVYED